MKTMDEMLPVLKRVMKVVSNTVGKDCELVLHDWSKGYDHSIIAIENGEVTNRKVGDCGSNLGLEVMRGTTKDGDRFNYMTRTNLGKILKSSTTYIENDEGEVIGALCVNVDITNYLNFKKAFELFFEEDDKFQTPSDTTENIEYHAKDIGELTDYLLAQSVQLVNKPVDKMNREDKMDVIRYLDNKGVFLITKSGDKVCQFLNISKFTLYNYLDAVRAEKE